MTSNEFKASQKNLFLNVKEIALLLGKSPSSIAQYRQEKRDIPVHLAGTINMFVRLSRQHPKTWHTLWLEVKKTAKKLEKKA